MELTRLPATKNTQFWESLAATDASRGKALQAILDAAVDGVVLIDHRRLIKAFNRSAERLFSYTAGEVLGGNVGILMSEAERAQHHQHIRRYLETGEPHIIGRGREVLAQRKDGASFPIFLSVGVLPDGPMTASDCGDKRYSRWCALTGCGGR